MTTLLPGYEYRDLGPDGGPYDETSHVKICWHTMETKNIGAAEGRYDRFPPHLGVVPPWPGGPAPVRRQYVGLDRHSYALSGSENDDEYVIQIEVAGFAKDMRTAPDVVLRWLATEILLPLEAALHVPRTIVPAGFHDTTTVPAGNGPLASSSSKIRLSSAELRAFSGHMGHQHAPAPDEHWDPGALPLVKIFSFAPINPKDDDMPAAKDFTAYERREAGGWYKLQADGGVVTGGNAPTRGSIFRLPEEKRQVSPGEFFNGLLVFDDHIVLITNRGDEYDSRSWGNK